MIDTIKRHLGGSLVIGLMATVLGGPVIWYVQPGPWPAFYLGMIFYCLCILILEDGNHG